MQRNATGKSLPAGEAPALAAAVFDKAALEHELAEAALVARLDRGAPVLASIIEDVSRLALLTRTAARGRMETASRERHAARFRFLMERMEEYRRQARSGDPVACYRVRNTIEILATSTRRAVIALSESRGVSSDADASSATRRTIATRGARTPGTADRSRAA
jgi:hypothetical protein